MWEWEKKKETERKREEKDDMAVYEGVCERSKRNTMRHFVGLHKVQ